MTVESIYNLGGSFSGALTCIAHSDLSRFGVSAMCESRLNHFKGTIKKTYYIEAHELQDIDGSIVPVSIDYVPCKNKADLLKQFKNYSIK